MNNQTYLMVESLRKYIKNEILTDYDLRYAQDLGEDTIRKFKTPKEYAEDGTGIKMPVLFVGFVNSSFSPFELSSDSNLESVGVNISLYHDNLTIALDIMGKIREGIFLKNFPLLDVKGDEVGTIDGGDFFDFERVDDEVFITLGKPNLTVLVGNTSINLVN